MTNTGLHFPLLQIPFLLLWLKMAGTPFTASLWPGMAMSPSRWPKEKAAGQERGCLRMIFLPDHVQEASDEWLFLFPSCLEQLQWLIPWPWGKAKGNCGNADPKPWHGELWTNSRPAWLTLLHEENKLTLTKPLVVSLLLANKILSNTDGEDHFHAVSFDWLANEIDLKVLPPLMASTKIFIKDFKYLCLIYIV